MSLTEICLAAAIMAAALIPMAGMIRQWTYAGRAEKMEAKFASFVSVKMDEYLYKKKWTEVTPTSGWVNVDPAKLDGIQAQYIVKIFPIVTLEDKFEFADLAYHEPCSAGSEKGSAWKTVTRKVRELELDTTSGASSSGNTAFLKEIELGLRWRWPGSDPNWEDVRNRAFFLTRRANLK